jgi:hypothetical protein
VPLDHGADIAADLQRRGAAQAPLIPRIPARNASLFAASQTGIMASVKRAQFKEPHQAVMTTMHSIFRSMGKPCG